MGKAVTLMNRPRRIVLIGSSRFRDLFSAVGAKLEKSGVLVLCMSFFQHTDDIEVTPEDRETLRWVDRGRIDLADHVHVIDGYQLYCEGCSKFIMMSIPQEPNRSHSRRFSLACHQCERTARGKSYIGEDTRHEIQYAESQGKTITYFSESPFPPCLAQK